MITTGATSFRLSWMDLRYQPRSRSKEQLKSQRRQACVWITIATSHTDHAMRTPHQPVPAPAWPYYAAHIDPASQLTLHLSSIKVDNQLAGMTISGDARGGAAGQPSKVSPARRGAVQCGVVR